MQTKIINLIALIALISIFNGCSIAVPDVPVCVEITPARGHCVHTISSKGFKVSDEDLYNGKTWWEIRPTMVMVPATSWAEIKKFIINVCAKTKKCDVEIAGWTRTIDAIDAKVKR